MTAESSSIEPRGARSPASLRTLRMACAETLLLHWPVASAELRRVVPDCLELDLLRGQAWVGLSAGRVHGLRSGCMPPIPGLSSTLELTVRTYVRCQGESGVYCLSTDASNPGAVWFGRRFMHLPCFRAAMRDQPRGSERRFSSRRIHQGATAAEFECAWAPHAPITRSAGGDLARAFTEHRQLFVVHREKVFAHALWQESVELRDVKLGALQSTMLEACGLTAPGRDPVAHHCDRLALAACPARELVAAEEAAALLDPALSPPLTFQR